MKKEVPYEEAIRVPLVIRADRIASATGRTDPHLVSNIDLAPTIAAAAGLPLPDADGRSLLPLLEGRPDGWRHALLIEHLRGTNPIPTYCAVRTSRYLYASYDTGEQELYDLAQDPFELENLAGSAPMRAGSPGRRPGAVVRSRCRPASIARSAWAQPSWRSLWCSPPLPSPDRSCPGQRDHDG